MQQVKLIAIECEGVRFSVRRPKGVSSYILCPSFMHWNVTHLVRSWTRLTSGKPSFNVLAIAVTVTPPYMRAVAVF